ncbi:MAG: hypothetical protein U0P81_14160 [Holophagaceae bacterium]
MGSVLRLFCFVIWTAAAACQAPGPVEPPRKVLLIGNSHAWSGDLPKRLEAVSLAAGAPLRLEVVAFADHGLGDHRPGGAAARRLAQGGFQVVLLQQGPSALEASRLDLRAEALRWSRDALRHGARPFLLGVWPSAGRRHDAYRSAESYRIAATEAGAGLCDAGEAWVRALSEDPGLPLYAADGLHAGPAGAYLAALVACARITGRMPPASSTAGAEDLPVDLVFRLRRMADATLAAAPAT